MRKIVIMTFVRFFVRKSFESNVNFDVVLVVVVGVRVHPVVNKKCLLNHHPVSSSVPLLKSKTSNVLVLQKKKTTFFFSLETTDAVVGE